MTERKSRIHRNKVDYGVNDYYFDYIKKTDNKHISRKVYGQIIKDYHSYLRDNLSSKGIPILLPCKMGRIELRKSKTEVTIKEDGSIENTLPVNWKETIKLWNTSETAKEKNIRIRFTNEHTNSYTFKIIYFKHRADFKNKSVYCLKFNRTLKRNLSASIFKGNIDAFINEY